MMDKTNSNNYSKTDTVHNYISDNVRVLKALFVPAIE